MTENLPYNYCALPLMPYACKPEESLGRIYDEAESKNRTCFQRDRDRIIHSSAFRRLKHKTQVFVYHEGDDYRSRLTHTIEVAQVARTLARSLSVNEDLAESIALAHDLGHTPFAHMGEDFLKNCMKDYGGFDHNDQSLRVLTTLEDIYPNWKGLNLTWETLEGVVKHNGPIIEKNKKWQDVNLNIACEEIQGKVDLRLDTYASLEAQVAALADDIAYNSHDIQDGVKSGMFSMDDIGEIDWIGEIISKVRQKYPDTPKYIHNHEIIRELMGVLVDDVMAESKSRLLIVDPKSSDDIRNSNMQIISFSDEMLKNVKLLKAFLLKRMYRHYKINRIWIKVEKIITDIFEAYMYTDYQILPDYWQNKIDEVGIHSEEKKARIIADYIAGMTDRDAIREHEKLFDLYWDLK